MREEQKRVRRAASWHGPVSVAECLHCIGVNRWAAEAASWVVLPCVKDLDPGRLGFSLSRARTSGSCVGVSPGLWQDCSLHGRTSDALALPPLPPFQTGRARASPPSCVLLGVSGDGVYRTSMVDPSEGVDPSWSTPTLRLCGRSHTEVLFIEYLYVFVAAEDPGSFAIASSRRLPIPPSIALPSCSPGSSRSGSSWERSSFEVERAEKGSRTPRWGMFTLEDSTERVGISRLGSGGTRCALGSACLEIECWGASIHRRWFLIAEYLLQCSAPCRYMMMVVLTL